MKKVLIADENLMAGKLLEMYVNQKDEYTVVQNLDEIDFLEQWCYDKRPDLMLLDAGTVLRNNKMGVLSEIKMELPDLKIIFMAEKPEYSLINRARAIQIDSFWYKKPNREELFDIINRTMKGESLYPDQIKVVRLGTAFSDEFTEREYMVLKELVKGKTDAQIGESLSYSVSMVKQMIQRMRQKTGWNNRVELAVGVIESGLVINEILK